MIKQDEHGPSLSRAAASGDDRGFGRQTLEHRQSDRALGENQSLISSIVAPASRFSNTRETGMRVPLNTQAPLALPGMLSTAEHCDQSRAAMFLPHVFVRGIWAPALGGASDGTHPLVNRSKPR